MSGDLAQVDLEIIKACMSPFYWHAPDWMGRRRICANGTLTYVRSAERTFGVTAAHVLRAYQTQSDPGARLQLGDADFTPDVIAISDPLDLATLAITPELMAKAGKDIIPVATARAGDIPREGRGIMLGGYIGEDRKELFGFNVEWNMLGVMGVARRVTEHQITWTPNRDTNVPVKGLPLLTPNKNLGGISGGPLIAWFEKAGGRLAYYSLAGIIVEAIASLENVVAVRADFIRPDGGIGAA